MAKIVKIEKGFLNEYIYVEQDDGKVVKYPKNSFKGKSPHIGQQVGVTKNFCGKYN